MGNIIIFPPLKYLFSKHGFTVLACLFVCCLPFKMVLCNILAIILLLYVILLSIYDRKIYFVENKTLFSILILPFAIQIIGFFFTDNFEAALFSTEKRMSMLLFLLVFFFNKYQFKEKDVILFMKCFEWSLAACIIVSVTMAAYNNYILNSFSKFDNSLFSDKLLRYVGINHLTYGLYASFAINFKIFMLVHKNFKISFLFWVPIAIITAGLILLVPKMGIISTIAGITYLIVFSSKRISGQNVCLLVAVLGVIAIIVFQLPKSKERFRQFSYGFSRNNIINDQGSYSANRAGAFYCSIDLIQIHGRFGLGTGDVESEMNDWFIKNNLSNLVGIDTHNQYFDYILAFGIIGLLIFIFSILYPLYLFHQEGYYLFAVFLIIMVLSFLTENYLNNNKGVMFFCFFNSLFASILKIKSNVTR